MFREINIKYFKGLREYQYNINIFQTSDSFMSVLHDVFDKNENIPDNNKKAFMNFGDFIFYNIRTIFEVDIVTNELLYRNNTF